MEKSPYRAVRGIHHLCCGHCDTLHKVLPLRVKTALRQKLRSFLCKDLKHFPSSTLQSVRSKSPISFNTFPPIVQVERACFERASGLDGGATGTNKHIECSKSNRDSDEEYKPFSSRNTDALLDNGQGLKSYTATNR
ncbi:hypothetical protein CBL_00896 [Carabus blaptoides fortunei]